MDAKLKKKDGKMDGGNWILKTTSKRDKPYE